MDTSNRADDMDLELNFPTDLGELFPHEDSELIDLAGEDLFSSFGPVSPPAHNFHQQKPAVLQPPPPPLATQPPIIPVSVVEVKPIQQRLLQTVPVTKIVPAVSSQPVLKQAPIQTKSVPQHIQPAQTVLVNKTNPQGTVGTPIRMDSNSLGVLILVTTLLVIIVLLPSNQMVVLSMSTNLLFWGQQTCLMAILTHQAQLIGHLS